MTRKDDIFASFLNDSILKNKYKIESATLPNSWREGMNSEIPIIKAIALIIDKLESYEVTKDNDLRNLVTQYLNQAI